MEIKQKKRRSNYGQSIGGKWNRIVENWPGHVIFENRDKSSGLWKALIRHGFKPQGDWMKDGRYKMWRVK